MTNATAERIVFLLEEGVESRLVQLGVRENQESKLNNARRYLRLATDALRREIKTQPED